MCDDANQVFYNLVSASSSNYTKMVDQYELYQTIQQKCDDKREKTKEKRFTSFIAIEPVSLSREDISTLKLKWDDQIECRNGKCAHQCLLSNVHSRTNSKKSHLSTVALTKQRITRHHRTCSCCFFCTHDQGDHFPGESSRRTGRASQNPREPWRRESSRSGCRHGCVSGGSEHGRGGQTWPDRLWTL